MKFLKESPLCHLPESRSFRRVATCDRSCFARGVERVGETADFGSERLCRQGTRRSANRNTCRKRENCHRRDGTSARFARECCLRPRSHDACSHARQDGFSRLFLRPQHKPSSKTRTNPCLRNPSATAAHLTRTKRRRYRMHRRDTEQFLDAKRLHRRGRHAVQALLKL